MAKPTASDMRTSLEDARFFYEKLNPIVRGPEQGQDLEVIRRYFRAYLGFFAQPPKKSIKPNSAIGAVKQTEHGWAYPTMAAAG